MSDDYKEQLERVRSERGEAIGKIIQEHLAVLNRLESHLGCARCRSPLNKEQRCVLCQPAAASLEGEQSE